MHATKQLNDVGLKATGPRLKVLEVFHADQHQHLTAEDIHRHMRDHKADVGLATIYRVLGQLTDVGILSRHVFESGKAVYEIHTGKHHDHLICFGCGRVDEFFDDVIEKRQRAIAQSSGYTLAQHQLALYGFCPGCRRVRGKSRAREK